MIRKRIWLVVLGSAFALSIEAMHGWFEEPDYMLNCTSCTRCVDSWLPAVVSSLIENNIDLNLPISNSCAHGGVSNPPLVISASNAMCGCAVKTVKTLLKAGADPNLNIDHGDSILHKVCKILQWKNHESNYQEYVNKQAQIVKLLLEYGADPNLRDKDGRIPLFQLYFHSLDSTGGRAISLMKDCVQSVIILFLLYGADITLKDNDGRDLIAFAKWRCQKKGVEFLKDWQDGKIKLKKKKLR